MDFTSIGVINSNTVTVPPLDEDTVTPVDNKVTINQDEYKERKSDIVKSQSPSIQTDYLVREGVDVVDVDVDESAKKKLESLVDTYQKADDNIFKMDYVGAKNAGVSASEIVDLLQEKGSNLYDFEGARQAGISDEEIVNALYTNTISKPDKHELRKEIAETIKYGGDSDFLLGTKQTGLSLASFATDLKHIAYTLTGNEDPEYKANIDRLQGAVEAMDREVDDKDFLSTHTLGEFTAAIAALPIAFESVGATVLLESVAGYAFARGREDVDTSLLFGAVGGVTGGVISGAISHFGARSIENGVDKLKKGLLRTDKERAAFDEFHKGFVEAHTGESNSMLRSNRKQKAIDEAHSLISFKLLGNDDSVLADIDFSYSQVFNLKQSAKEREDRIAALIKVDNAEGSISSIFTGLHDGMRLVGKQYGDVKAQFSTLPIDKGDYISLQREINGQIDALTSKGAIEDLNMPVYLFKKASDKLESASTLEDILDVKTLLGDAARKLDKEGASFRGMSKLLSAIDDKVKANMTAGQYNMYKSVARSYSRMKDVQDTKLYRLFEGLDTKGNVDADKMSLLSATKGTKEVTTAKGDMEITNGILGTRPSYSIDTVLEEFSKLKLNDNILEKVYELLPTDEAGRFEKMLVQHTLTDNGGISLDALGEVLGSKGFRTKEGREIQKLHDIITKYHDYDRYIKGVTSSRQYVEISTRSNAEATVGAALTRALFHTAAKVPFIGAGFKTTREKMMTSKLLGMKASNIVKSLGVNGENMSANIWRTITTEAEAILESMDTIGAENRPLTNAKIGFKGEVNPSARLYGTSKVLERTIDRTLLKPINDRNKAISEELKPIVERAFKDKVDTTWQAIDDIIDAKVRPVAVKNSINSKRKFDVVRQAEVLADKVVKRTNTLLKKKGKEAIKKHKDYIKKQLMSGNTRGVAMKQAQIKQIERQIDSAYNISVQQGKELRAGIKQHILDAYDKVQPSVNKWADDYTIPPSVVDKANEIITNKLSPNDALLKGSKAVNFVKGLQELNNLPEGDKLIDILRKECK